MMVSRHVIFSVPPTAAAYYFTGSLLNTAFFFAGAVFIDADHYLDYVFRQRSLSLRAAYRHNIEISRLCLERRYDKPIIHCFHTIEFFLFIALLSFFLPPLRWLLAGMAFHVALDVVEILRLYDPRIRIFSFIYYKYRRKGRA